jgi:hypothetical protein
MKLLNRNTKYRIAMKPLLVSCGVSTRLFSYWFENENYTFAPRCGFTLMRIYNRYLLGFNLYGFRKARTPKPLCNKVYLMIYLLFFEISFRIGIQYKTWFWLRWEEGFYFIYRLKLKLNSKSAYPF